MIRRPSTRRHSHGNQIHLDLVPILDALVTLVTFLLLSGSFLALTAIDVPVAESGADINQKPLQLTIYLQNDATLLEAGAGQILAQRIAHLAPGEPNLEALVNALRELKKNYPQEKTSIFMPVDTISYETLVKAMDAVRFDGSTELFPQVVLGNTSAHAGHQGPESR